MMPRLAIYMRRSTLYFPRARALFGTTQYTDSGTVHEQGVTFHMSAVQIRCRCLRAYLAPLHYILVHQCLYVQL